MDWRGARADYAENGRIAVEMFKKSDPDCYDAILMDVRMPGWTEAAKAIRARGGRYALPRRRGPFRQIRKNH